MRCLGGCGGGGAESSYDLQGHLGDGSVWPDREGCEERSPGSETKHCSHGTQTSSWVPGAEGWECSFGLPLGWEMAVDGLGRAYYIDHKAGRTTYGDPRVEVEAGEEGGSGERRTEPRTLRIQRDGELGFGFVAGSERPVVVRFVSEGGPSWEKLLPGDQILAVNGADVSGAAKDEVVRLVKASGQSMVLTVSQPRLRQDSQLKSALLSAHKRVRLKSAPSHVRFADGVRVGTPPHSPCGTESMVAWMPNVLRVFLENGGTKSFKYDEGTSVGEVVESLAEKLGFLLSQHLALMLEHPVGPRSAKLSLLGREEAVCRVAARPGSQHFRCLLRVGFVPGDPLAFHQADPALFAYYYAQCVNDVVGGRFVYEMRYEAALRLAALHLHQLALDTRLVQPNSKPSLRALEKEYGLPHFLPALLLDNVKRKEIRKHLRYYLKRDASRQNTPSGTPKTTPRGTPTHSATASGSGSASGSQDAAAALAFSLQLKYVHMLSHLPSFGGRSFHLTFKDTNTDMVLQVHPRSGLLVRNSGRCTEPSLTLTYESLAALRLTSLSPVLRQFSISLHGDASQELEFLVDRDDCEDLTELVRGYHSLAVPQRAPLAVRCESPPREEQEETAAVPPYAGLHSVRPAGWNFAPDPQAHSTQCLLDLSRGPPPYHRPDQPPPPFPPSRLSKPSSALPDKHSFVSTSAVSPTPQSHKSQPPKSPGHSGRSPAPKAPAVAPPAWAREEVAADVHGEASETSEAQESLSDLRPAPVKKTSSDEPSLPKTFLRAKDSLLIASRDRSESPVWREKRGLREEVEVGRGAGEGVSGAGGASSGSESESLSTPSESPVHKGLSRPAKARPSNLLSSPASGLSRKGSSEMNSEGSGAVNPSFGLQSPDTLPCSVLSDSELQDILASAGLSGQELEELLLLFPDNICTDSDITDLTLLPSPTGPRAAAGATAAAEDVLADPPTPFRDPAPEGPSSSSQRSWSWTRKAAWLEGERWPSIEQDPERFETFLRASIIPPPPPKDPKDLDDAQGPTDQPPTSPKKLPDQAENAAVEGVTHVEAPHAEDVRFGSANRERSSSGGLERLLVRQRLKERIREERSRAGPSIPSSSSFPAPAPNALPPMDHIRKILRVDRSMSLNRGRGWKQRRRSVKEEGSASAGHSPLPSHKPSPKAAQPPSDLVYCGEDDHRIEVLLSPGPHSDQPDPIQKVSLNRMTGLEASECSPHITRVALGDYDGTGIHHHHQERPATEAPAAPSASPPAVKPRQRKESFGRALVHRFRSVDVPSVPAAAAPASQPKTERPPSLAEQPLPYGSDPRSFDQDDAYSVRRMELSSFTGLEQGSSGLSSMDHGSVDHSSVDQGLGSADHTSAELGSTGKASVGAQSTPSGSSSVSAKPVPPPAPPRAPKLSEAGAKASLGTTTSSEFSVHSEDLGASSHHFPSAAASGKASGTAAGPLKTPHVAVFGSPGRRGVRFGGSGAFGGVGNGSLVPIVHSESVDSVPDAAAQDPTPEEFVRVQTAISQLHAKLGAVVGELPLRSPKRGSGGPAEAREARRAALVGEAQRLAAASKALVRAGGGLGAGPGSGALGASLARALGRAEGVWEATVAVLGSGQLGLWEAGVLGAKVGEVLAALAAVVGGVREAQGRALADPHVKRLMRLSTTLAATLTQLVCTLRDLA